MNHMEVRHSVHVVARTRRLLVGFQVFTAFVFAGLLMSFWYFQVGQHSKYLAMAENNHQRHYALRAPRGVVFDRDGRVLIENRNSLNIALARDQMNNVEQLPDSLAEVLDLDAQVVREALLSRSNESHRPIVIVRDASLAQVAAVSARRLEFPSVIVEQTPARHYPSDKLAAHLFGYVGEVTNQQLLLAKFDNHRSGDIVGQSGVELRYDNLLMGIDGSRHVTVNSLGREIKALGEVLPIEGNHLRLTIDYDLQRAVEDAFQHAGFTGAAVVMDPSSGELLSLVSLPAYDPNAFSSGIDLDSWARLNSDAHRPLQNRALQGRYAPGSTFKIAMAVAALEEGVIDSDFEVSCRGGGTFYGRFFRCHTTHGRVGLDEALEKSCNTYFYTLGEKLDIDQISKWSRALGLGEITGIDLPFEVQGIVPSRAWKRDISGERWYPGETISVAIGQGQVSVTPISLAVMMSTLANGGDRVTPQLLKAYNDGTGWRQMRLGARGAASSPAPISQETIGKVMQSLWMVVNREGSGRRGRIEGRDVVGKTGTAQVISLAGRDASVGSERDLRDHGWFVFAAPRDNPEIAGVVFGEHSEHGYLAASIARHVMETFFAKRDGRTLPNLTVPVQVRQPIPTFNTPSPNTRPNAGGG